MDSSSGQTERFWKETNKQKMLKSSNWETIHRSINWWTDSHTIGYFSAIKKVQNVDKYNKMNESQKQANWKKSRTKSYIVYDSIIWFFLKGRKWQKADECQSKREPTTKCTKEH